MTTASNGDRGVYKGYAVQRSTTDIPPVVKTVTTNITNYNYVPPPVVTIPPVVTPPSGGGTPPIVVGARGTLTYWWGATATWASHNNGGNLRYPNNSHSTGSVDGWSINNNKVCGSCGSCVNWSAFTNTTVSLCDESVRIRSLWLKAWKKTINGKYYGTKWASAVSVRIN